MEVTGSDENWKYFLSLLMGLATVFWWLVREIDRDNRVSSEMALQNDEPYQVMGKESLQLPWSDSLANLDPENNGPKRIKRWNFRKVQLMGYFKNKAVLGKTGERVTASAQEKRWEGRSVRVYAVHDDSA